MAHTYKIIAAPGVAYKGSPYYINKGTGKDGVEQFEVVDPIFHDFLKRRTQNGRLNSDLRITEAGGLYDPATGYTWYRNHRVFDTKTHSSGTWRPNQAHPIWDSSVVKQDKNNTSAAPTNKKRRRVIGGQSNTTIQDTSTQPGWTPDNFERSYFGSTSQFNTDRDNLDDNSYAVNGIQRGFDGRSSIGIQSNWNRRRDGLRGNQALQQINQKFGQNFTDVKSAQNYINQMLMNSSRITGTDMGNISVDGKWGDQSQRALDFVSSIYDKNGNTWDNVSQNNPYADKARTINPNVSIPKPTTPTTPNTSNTSNTALDMFTNDDIRNLGFKNYSGLISAVTNKANVNNNFVKAFTTRYGNDASKYNQAKIENELGVKGKYRSFGGGDFGDMSRNMASWMGTYNGNLERKNLKDRTGSDGIVYSNKHVRDLFEAHPVKPKTFTFDTNSFGTNIFGTPKKQQGGQINMNEQQLQQAFLQYLMQKTGAKNEQQLEQVVQQLGEDGLKQAYAQFMQEVQQQQVQAAKFGAKLNYIKKLNGQCPEGMEMHYYKQGGRLCRKCMQIKQNEVEMESPSNPIDAFKCGRKIKKDQHGKKLPQINSNKNGQDQATKDSIAANRYNDQDVQVNRPGSYKKNAKGRVQWVPDRKK